MEAIAVHMSSLGTKKFFEGYFDVQIFSNDPALKTNMTPEGHNDSPLDSIQFLVPPALVSICVHLMQLFCCEVDTA